MIDVLNKALESTVSYVAVGLVAGLGWVVRRVFTNQKQIELLRTENKSREELRARDREDMQELKADVKSLTEHILKNK